MRSASPLSRIEGLDKRVMARIASADSPFLDHVLPRLGRVADHSVLWVAIALGLGATRNGRARRAALRGLAGVIIASTAANVVAKGLTGRARPSGEIPPRRRRRIPHTTSFPSGHSASAAAFATGVALELPWLAAPIGAVAVAVGASRVVTGVHYPSDVLAGFAIGAATGALTLHWWPRRPDPDTASPTHTARMRQPRGSRGAQTPTPHRRGCARAADTELVAAAPGPLTPNW